MLHQFAGLFECVATNRALIQVGVGVGARLMLGQQCGRFEAFVAVFAREWIALGVRFQVKNETARIHETLVAHLALVWLSCGMRSHVHHQTARLREGLRAEFAFVRFFAAVNSNVSVQAADVRE